MSSTQTLSLGGVLQAGKARSSSPMTALLEVAHPGTHPIHLPPPPMVAEVTLDGKGYSRGRCPVRRFPWMENCVKLLRFSTHRGNSPDSWLSPSNNLCREEMPPSSDGIGPLSPLLWRYSCVRLDRFPSSDGIDPLRLLLLSRSCARLARFPSSDGIDPLRLLLLSRSCARLARFPSSDGIDPLRLLLLKFSSLRLARFPSSDGIDPLRLLPPMVRLRSSGRFPSSGGSVPFTLFGLMMMVATRSGVPAKPTPPQLDIAVDAFQFK